MADQVPKKLSPMMQKKLEAEQASGVPEAKTEPVAPKVEPVPKAEPVAKAAPKVAPAATATSDNSRFISAENKIPNPNGERYGYGDGLASVFGEPPAIDEAYFALKTVSGIPAAIVEGGIKFFKTVAGMK